MKTLLTSAVLSSKVVMLLCISCMSFFGMEGMAMAEEMAPCHEVAMEETVEMEEAPCDMCETAMDVLGEDLVALEAIAVEGEIDAVALLPTTYTNIIVAELLDGEYKKYNAPPDVAWKAVTPNTKTIVVLS